MLTVGLRESCLLRLTLSLRLELGRIVVESEDFEKPCKRDEQSPSNPNHWHPSDLAVAGGDLVREVASDAEQPCCFRDCQGGADRADRILLFVGPRCAGRSETLGERPYRNQLRVGERVVTDTAGNGQGRLPVLGDDELVKRHLELPMESFHCVVSTDHLIR